MKQSLARRDAHGNRVSSSVARTAPIGSLPSRRLVLVEPRGEGTRRGSLAVTMSVVTVAVLAIAGMILRASASETGPVAETSARADRAWEAVEIRANGRGQLLQVTGPDPRMVLRAFCEPSSSRRLCKPVEITVTDPPTASRRLGIFKDPQRAGLRAIEIVRGDRAQSWTAGDGLHPVAVMPAPERSAETAAIPVHKVR